VVSKAKISKGKYESKLEFQEGWEERERFKPNYSLWERYRYFLAPNQPFKRETRSKTAFKSFEIVAI